MPDLSQNERLVLPLFADGRKPSNREIADKLKWTINQAAGTCFRLRQKNMIPARRDIQFIRERPVVKGPTCQYIQGEPPKPWDTDEIKCGKPVHKRSWCAKHYEVCYPKRVQYKPKLPTRAW